MVVATAKKWVGYLEHKSLDLLGVYDGNVGKGGYTIFADIITRHYRWRCFQGFPWCAVFVHAVFLEALGKERAEKILGKPHPGTRVLARRMRRRGLLRGQDYTPKAGDLIFLSNGDGRISHCGIVTAVDGNTVTSIEGNTVDPTGHFDRALGGAVVERMRDRSDPAILTYAATGGNAE